MVVTVEALEIPISGCDPRNLSILTSFLSPDLLETIISRPCTDREQIRSVGAISRPHMLLAG